MYSLWVFGKSHKHQGHRHNPWAEFLEMINRRPFSWQTSLVSLLKNRKRQIDKAWNSLGAMTNYLATIFVWNLCNVAIKLLMASTSKCGHLNSGCIASRQSPEPMVTTRVPSFSEAMLCAVCSTYTVIKNNQERNAYCSLDIRFLNYR